MSETFQAKVSDMQINALQMYNKSFALTSETTE